MLQNNCESKFKKTFQYNNNNNNNAGNTIYEWAGTSFIQDKIYSNFLL